MSTAAAPDLVTLAPLTPGRAVGLDRLRGAAVALMVLDHLLIVTGNEHSPLRYTLTRLAMPVFALLAGHLVRRWGLRWSVVVAVGLLIPSVVPWVDGSPNILVELGLGAAVVLGARRLAAPWILWVGVCLPLVLFANGLLPNGPDAYQVHAVIGLMCLGALAPRAGFCSAGARVPAAFAWLGRFPLSVYVGHLLVLELVVLLVHGA